MSAQPAQITTLDSGVRVATEAMPSVRSIALGFWVRTGSRDESPQQAGLSHFLEHLLFKGTDRFSSREIDEPFDAMGAEVNAGTGKETTSVYSRFLDGQLERAFDVLQDMFQRPAYPDIDSERQVVIEEIAMYEDEPQDKVHDVLAGRRLRRAPAGPPGDRAGRGDLLGARAGHRRLARPPLRARQHRGCGRRAISTTTASSRLVDGAVGDPGPVPEIADSPNGSEPSRGASSRRRPSSTTSASGAQGSRGGTTAVSPCAILDTILGGSTSSRLFQEVREKRGLAYAVFSYSSHFADSGQVAVYVGTRPDNVGEAMGVIGAELRRLLRTA